MCQWAPTIFSRASMAAAATPRPSPSTARSKFLMLEHGLVHRLASLNAYAGCSPSRHAARDAVPDLPPLRQCRRAGKPEPQPRLDQAATGRDFAMDAQIVEITGLCAHCRAPHQKRPARARRMTPSFP